jgi:hypothetical protein
MAVISVVRLGKFMFSRSELVEIYYRDSVAPPTSKRQAHETRKLANPLAQRGEKPA